MRFLIVFLCVVAVANCCKCNCNKPRKLKICGFNDFDSSWELEKVFSELQSRVTKSYQSVFKKFQSCSIEQSSEYYSDFQKYQNELTNIYGSYEKSFKQYKSTILKEFKNKQFEIGSEEYYTTLQQLCDKYNDLLYPTIQQLNQIVETSQTFHQSFSSSSKTTKSSSTTSKTTRSVNSSSTQSQVCKKLKILDYDLDFDLDSGDIKSWLNKVLREKFNSLYKSKYDQFIALKMSESCEQYSQYNNYKNKFQRAVEEFDKCFTTYRSKILEEVKRYNINFRSNDCIDQLQKIFRNHDHEISSYFNTLKQVTTESYKFYETYSKTEKSTRSIDSSSNHRGPGSKPLGLGHRPIKFCGLNIQPSDYKIQSILNYINDEFSKDCLKTLEELRLLNVDSDGDGINDYEEVLNELESQMESYNKFYQSTSSKLIKEWQRLKISESSNEYYNELTKFLSNHESSFNSYLKQLKSAVSRGSSYCSSYSSHKSSYSSRSVESSSYSSSSQNQKKIGKLGSQREYGC